MVAPIPRPVGVQLTGNVRHRVGFRGCLVLQVEVEYHTQTTPFSEQKGPHLLWRDARTSDLATTALSTLTGK